MCFSEDLFEVQLNNASIGDAKEWQRVVRIQQFMTYARRSYMSCHQVTRKSSHLYTVPESQKCHNGAELNGPVTEDQLTQSIPIFTKVISVSIKPHAFMFYLCAFLTARLNLLKSPRRPRDAPSKVYQSFYCRPNSYAC